MAIHVSNAPIHLQEGVKLTREYARAQESRNADQNGFQKDSLRAFRLLENREALMDKFEHTVWRSVTSFGDTRAELLKGVREENGQYDYSDIINAVGLSYAKHYSEIEQRYTDGQQYYKADGTTLTKEEEMGWLDQQFEQEVKWQKACTRIAAEGQVFQGHMKEVPIKEIEELEDCFYQAKDAYLKLYRENRQGGYLPALQKYRFGSNHMYECLNKCRNF